MSYRDILLCVTGLTPQVVTETLYALIQEQTEGADARVPERVEVITTTAGQRRIMLSLFSQSGGQGYFDQLCDHYGIQRGDIVFDATCIHVIHDRDGRPLADIVNGQDNAAAADLINERIRALTGDNDVRLHVSLAGGRKTMGFYAGYALSLYARPQDRLSHVLVNAPFESHPAFFYPPPQPNTLVLPGNKDLASTAAAQVQLADIPFVRLRNELDTSLLQGDLSFSDVVARAQQILERPDLRIDVGERRVWLQGQRVDLSTTHFIWLTWFALRARNGEPPVGFDEDAVRALSAVMDWLEGDGPSPVKDGLASALDEFRDTGKANYFDRTRSRLNSALAERSGLHPMVVERYQIHSRGNRPHTVYSLNLPPEQILIEGEP
ncbi:CRISPR-associated ring nuclease Csm6 [Arhodomonas sp. AD133]|uniref:CRISPR-associated ring nuclease Csm6 n=1 Tax=Arhodomonas sp. AD133 TaxID=3415009 RepID=UPI003EBFA088